MNARNRRLSLSFALALCAGVACFGLLDALISVRVALTTPTIPHVAYRPIELWIAARPEIPDRGCNFEIIEHFPAPRPAIPALEFTPIFVDMHDEQSAREVREFDALEAIRVFNASHIDV